MPNLQLELNPKSVEPAQGVRADKTHLHETRCAICKTFGQATELYSATIEVDAINSRVFAARRLSDRVHFRMVRCNRCGLVRSDPVIDTAQLNAFYTDSTFDYGSESHSLRRTYGKYLARARRLTNHCESLLEIGCGNGFLLEEALEQGIPDIHGVEPCVAAIEAARPGVREKIVCDVLRPNLFSPETFDLICFFQIFDHVPDPMSFLADCWTLLKPGGVLLALNHNVESWSAYLLKERSPIIDVGHMYLYSPATMMQILTNAGFKVVEAGTVWNRYSLHYLTRLLPMPTLLKRGILAALKASRLGYVPMSVPLGNLYQIARKPH